MKISTIWGILWLIQLAALVFFPQYGSIGDYIMTSATLIMYGLTLIHDKMP